jgi:oxygen-dependent protoporphyrinogen oxidase
MVYAAAGKARALAALGDDEIRRVFLQDLAQVLPGAADVVSEVVLQRWEQGLPYAAVGRGRLQPALRRDLGPVHLAGDYLGTWYTETACQTAEAASAAIASLLAR